MASVVRFWCAEGWLRVLGVTVPGASGGSALLSTSSVMT